MQPSRELPVCLVISGHDPTGGAGLQADIEAIISMGGHAVTLATSYTVQDTVSVHDVEPVEPGQLLEQANYLLNDVSVSAVKLGLLPSVAVVETVSHILDRLPRIPVVLDPVLSSGSGRSMQSDASLSAIKSLLLPRVTVVTPNTLEARELADNADTLEACAMSLLDTGCEYILVTGGHEQGEQIYNTLYHNNQVLEHYEWPRMPGDYHGTGCTLASALAGRLAQGQQVQAAARQAQEYTQMTIEHAFALGNGQLIPDRLYWSRNMDRDPS